MGGTGSFSFQFFISWLAMHIYRFCYTHTRPLFPISSNVVCVWVGDEPIPEDLRPRTVSVKDLFDDLDFYRPWLYGSAASIAALRTLRALPDFKPDGLIVQSSFRKFVTSRPIGRDASNFPGLRLATVDEIPDDIFNELPASGCLIPQPTVIGNLTLQYAQAHRLPDLFRYTSICYDLGVLTGAECAEFLQSDILIPGCCELSILPMDIWVDVLDKFDRVTTIFCRQGLPVDLSPYQRRAVAFCNERLGSYLVIKHLAARFGSSLPPDLFGYLINVTKNKESIYSGGT